MQKNVKFNLNLTDRLSANCGILTISYRGLAIVLRTAPVGATGYMLKMRYFHNHKKSQFNQVLDIGKRIYIDVVLLARYLQPTHK